MNNIDKIMSEMVVYSKYAKHLPEEDRRETWEEIVERNIEMHTRKFPILKDAIRDVYEEFVLPKRVFPSMRSLQFSGKAITVNPTRIFNCAYMPIDSYVAFSELMFLLLGGSGVGVSVQNYHIGQLGMINRPNERDRRYVIDDSIIGWAEAIRVLMDSYFLGKDTVRFDYTDIRPKGSPLVTAGGKAPGFEPLQLAIESIHSLLDSKLEYRDKCRLDPIDAYDISCFIAKAVLAGGIRRSAIITIFDADDDDMLHAKSGEWWVSNPQRSMSNNSAVVYRNDPKANDKFYNVWDIAEKSGAGEPASVFSNDIQYGFNPCLLPDSIVETVEGRVKIKDITEPIKVYTMLEDGSLGIRQASASWVTKRDAETIEVETRAGHIVKCTPEHKIFTINRDWVEAGDLKLGDNLVHLNKGGDSLTTNLIDQSGTKVIAIREGIRSDVYDLTVEDTHNFIADFTVVHNCVEIALKEFSFCNLVEVVVDGIDSQDEFNDMVSAGSFIGTLQASYTDFTYLRSVWRDNTEEHALVGVGLTGIGSGDLDNLDLKEAAQIAIDTNITTAAMIGINPADRVTTIKPSGCRPKTGLVTTEQGVYTLGELLVHHLDDEWSIVEDDIDITQDVKSNKMTRTFKNGIERVYTVNMMGGLIVESTANHPWYVVGKGFVATENIVSGDVLDIKIGVYNNKEHFKLTDDDYIKHPNDRVSNSITTPQYMSEDLAWLIGYLWGDGSLSPMKNRIRFTDEHVVNLDKASMIIKELFGLDSSIHDKHGDTKAKEIEIGSVALWSWLHLNGIKKYSETGLDNIPLCVRQSAKSDIISFIAGFSDADGCVSHTKGKGYRTLTVSQSFKTGFTRHLQDVALSVGIHLTHSFNTKGENFQETKDMVLMYMTQYSQKESVDILASNMNKASIKSPDLPFPNDELGMKKTFTIGKVESVEYSFDAETFDIEVENDHWFYAGAVKSHNTSSLVAGTSSGIHAWFSDYYIRRIRVNKGDPMHDYLASMFDGEFFEDDKMDPGASVMSFPIKAPKGAKLRTETMVELLERVKRFNLDWVQEGYVKGSNHNNVSCTISVKDGEWDDLKDWMWENRDNFNGISALPFDGGTYNQLPFEDITKEEYMILSEKMNKINLDFSTIVETEDGTDLSGEAACAGGACEITGV